MRTLKLLITTNIDNNMATTKLIENDKLHAAAGAIVCI